MDADQRPKKAETVQAEALFQGCPVVQQEQKENLRAVAGRINAASLNPSNDAAANQSWCSVCSTKTLSAEYSLA
jgi:hypothetical protein